jgi:hypothetical protein
MKAVTRTAQSPARDPPIFLEDDRSEATLKLERGHKDYFLVSEERTAVTKMPLNRKGFGPSKGGGMNSARLTPPTTISSTLAFYQEDFGKTLFPLRTNRILIERGEDELKAYIAQCLDQARTGLSFPAQHRVYADKPGFHLRRTVKLDPVAEYYIYDVIFRNQLCLEDPILLPELITVIDLKPVHRYLLPQLTRGSRGL